MRKIALISEHASPLASVGSTDCGGQNIYVAHLARQLGTRGYLVDVFTRRDKALLPEVVAFAPNVHVIHVPAGPPVQVPKEQLLPYMDAFGEFLVEFIRHDPVGYDVLHAGLDEVVGLGTAVGPREQRQAREMRAGHAHDLERALAVAGGDDEQPRPLGAGGAQEVEP